MPKITTSTSTAQLRVTVSRHVLDQYRAALSEADKAGLKVDVQTDFDQLLKRLTKAIMDAVQEAAPEASLQPSEVTPPRGSGLSRCTGVLMDTGQ